MIEWTGKRVQLEDESIMLQSLGVPTMHIFQRKGESYMFNNSMDDTYNKRYEE